MINFTFRTSLSVSLTCDIDVNPATGTVCLFVRNFSGGNSVYRSTDGGQTFTDVLDTGFTAQTLERILFSNGSWFITPGNDRWWKSLDDGATWTTAPNGPLYSNNVYGAASDGVTDIISICRVSSGSTVQASITNTLPTIAFSEPAGMASLLGDGVFWDGSKFVAVGQDSGGTATSVYTAPNGFDLISGPVWTLAGSTAGTNILGSNGFNQGGFDPYFGYYWQKNVSSTASVVISSTPGGLLTATPQVGFYASVGAVGVWAFNKSLMFLSASSAPGQLSRDGKFFFPYDPKTSEEIWAMAFDPFHQVYVAVSQSGNVATAPPWYDYSAPVLSGGQVLTNIDLNWVQSPFAAPVMLLHFEDGANTFIDSAAVPNVMTAGGSNGTATESTTQSKFGAGSMYLSGWDCGIHCPFNSGSPIDIFHSNPEWTIEYWVWPTAGMQSPSNVAMHVDLSSGVTDGVRLYEIVSSSEMVAQMSGSWAGGGSLICDNASVGWAYGAWNHVALVRTGYAAAGRLDFYVNGQQPSGGGATTASSALWAALPGSGNLAYFGNGYNSGSTQQGSQFRYIDEIRITPAALYRGPFTPPTAPGVPAGLTPPYWGVVRNGVHLATVSSPAYVDMTAVVGTPYNYNVYASSDSGAVYHTSALSNTFSIIPAAVGLPIYARLRLPALIPPVVLAKASSISPKIYSPVKAPPL